jgi:hypothetical protein
MEITFENYKSIRDMMKTGGSSMMEKMILFFSTHYFSINCAFQTNGDGGTSCIL